MEYTMSFLAAMPGKVVGGEGSILRLPELIIELNGKKVLLFVDKGVQNAGLSQKPIEYVKTLGLETIIVDDVPTEPSKDEVLRLYNLVSEYNIDVVVGIGGGSVLDVAKLIAAMLANDKTLEELLLGDAFTHKCKSLILVPTTSGTGSEATPNSIITIPEKELKIGIVSSKMMADYVILDPSLTYSLPPAITAATGMDAFIHAIECYISNKSNPMSDSFALRAIELIYPNLIAAYENGCDKNARYAMQLGAFFGGLSIASSGTAAVHALAYPLGGKYKISHGVSNSMLFAHVMEYNKNACINKFETMAKIMKISDTNTSSEQAAQLFVDEMHNMSEALNIPDNIREFGAEKKDLDMLVKAALLVVRLLNNNPQKLEAKDIRNIYEKLF